MNVLETGYEGLSEDQSLDHPDFQHRLEDIESFKPEADPTLSPESQRAMQQRIQGLEQTENVPPSDMTEGKIIGTPEQDAQYLHQQTGETCATVAQEGIIEKQTGVDYGEKALAQEAYENGWTDADGGTYPDCIGNLLENHEVPTQRWLDGSADLSTLKNELAQGHDVIVGVDAGEFYQDAGLLGSGHAVWVTGVENNAQGDVSRVIVNDSNFTDPQVHDIAIFQNAWDSGGRLMVATC